MKGPTHKILIKHDVSSPHAEVTTRVVPRYSSQANSSGSKVLMSPGSCWNSLKMGPALSIIHFERNIGEETHMYPRDAGGYG